jgi:DNA polymerase/3'-5' exonuclease PolX
VSAGARLPLERAREVATTAISLLATNCERIEVAGSIRRQRPEVGDVEIVCVPQLVNGPFISMFERPRKVSALEKRVTNLLRSGSLQAHPTRPANGERYKRLWIPSANVQLDLFIVLPGGPAEWGPIFAIRTGPAAYSQACVTALRRKGWVCREGRVLDERGNVVPCPEEQDFFEACGVPYLRPEERT